MRCFSSRGTRQHGVGSSRRCVARAQAPIRSRKGQLARTDSDRGAADESKQVLEAFFYGKAVAEVLNARLGESLADLLAEVSTADAERQERLKEFQAQPVEFVQQALTDLSEAASRRRQERADRFRAFQDEVRAVAERDMVERMGATVPARGTAAAEADPSLPPPMPDVQEAVDDVRAEIAATRSKLQALRLRTPEVDEPLFRRSALV